MLHFRPPRITLPYLILLSLLSRPSAFVPLSSPLRRPSPLLSASDADDRYAPPPLASDSDSASPLTDGDAALISRLLAASSLSAEIEASLPEISPAFLSRLDRAADSDGDGDGLPQPVDRLRSVRDAILSERSVLLERGRDTLQSLLASGELRKLDGQIGRLMREGRLDPAFFSVLTLNLRQAEEEDAGKDPSPGEDGDPPPPRRLQVLQHVYTRCVEEVEKAAPAGPALLNRLLRTEIPSIRRNQLSHYLGPQKTSVSAPDGTTIELPNNAGPLVKLEEFLAAVGEAVAGIRRAEKAGGGSRKAAAALVEQCRTVAKEARGVLVEVYGERSEEVRSLEGGLQPVFRPGTTIETIEN